MASVVSAHVVVHPELAPLSDAADDPSQARAERDQPWLSGRNVRRLELDQFGDRAPCAVQCSVEH